MKTMLFSKMLHRHTWTDLAHYANDLKCDGIDLTCRQGGHVLPEQAAHNLPRAVSYFASQGLQTPMITTAFTSARDDHAETVFQAAAACGVSYIKLGYWVVESFGAVSQRYEQMKQELDGLEALAKRYRVCALLHIHSENVLNNNPALIAQLLRHRDGSYMGAYIDPAHLVVAGGQFGWWMGMDWLAPYVKMVGVKNMIWVNKEKENAVAWEAKIAPLRQGIVPWPTVVRLLKEIGYDGYFSIFGEYWEPISFKVMDVSEMVEQVREDIEYLKELWSMQV